MKKERKNKSLFSPVVWLFAALIFATLVYALVRFLILSAEGSGNSMTDALFSMLWEVVPALGVLLVAALGTAIILQSRVSSPVKKLTGSVGKIADGLPEKKPFEKTEAAGGLMLLSEALAEETGSLITLFATTRKKTEEDTERRVRLQLAREVFLSAVPEQVAFDALTYGVCARARLSETVGADFCDAVLLDKNRIFLAVGDVWGEGLPAVLVASRIKSELRANIFAGKNLAETLVSVNAMLCGSQDGLPASAFLALFDPGTGELRYANAGHYAPVVAGGQLGFLRVKAGTPLGAFGEFSAEEMAFRLCPGQGLVLYTDGVVSARGEKGAFGFDNLLKTAKLYCTNSLGAEYIANGVISALDGYSAEDLAVVALYYPNGIQRLFHADLGETAKLSALLAEWLASDPRRKKILQVCNEIFVNIVKHAGASSIQISCQKEENKLILRFTDDGEPFDPLSVTEERNPYEFGEGVGGSGMSIIRQISGEIFYRTRENLNVLTIRLPLIQGF